MWEEAVSINCALYSGSLSEIKRTSNKCQLDLLLKDSLLIIRHLCQRGPVVGRSQWQTCSGYLVRFKTSIINKHRCLCISSTWKPYHLLLLSGGWIGALNELSICPLYSFVSFKWQKLPPGMSTKELSVWNEKCIDRWLFFNDPSSLSRSEMMAPTR